MGAPIKVDAGWLREQYVDRQRSAKNISEEIGCSVMGVIAALDRTGIPRRRRLEARRATPPHKRGRVQMPEAAEMYVAGTPLKLLGKRYGVSWMTVRQVLEGAGVEIRASRESAKIRWADPEYREFRLAALDHRRRPTGVRELKRLLPQDATCCFCGTSEAVEQHHLNGVRSDHRPENIAPLCRDCHAKVEWLVGRATEGLRRAYRGEQPDLRLAT